MARMSIVKAQTMNSLNRKFTCYTDDDATLIASLGTSTVVYASALLNALY